MKLLAEIGVADAIGEGALQDPALVGFVVLVVLLTGLVLDVFWVRRFLSCPEIWRKGVSRLMWRPWRGQHVLVLIIALLLIGFVMQGLISLLALSFNFSDEQVEALGVFALTLGFYVCGSAIFVYFLKDRQDPLRGAFGGSDFSVAVQFGQAVGFYLAMLPLVVLAAFAYKQVISFFGYEPALQEAFQMMDAEKPSWRRIYLVVTAVLLAPVFEEMVFRGLLLPLAAKMMGVTRGIIVVSLLFALIHFHVPAMVPLFFLAMALSAAYIYTQSLLVPILMHAIFNGMNLLAYTLGVN